MNNTMNNTYMTIQERIELMKKSKAFSPFDAARKVLNISDTVLFEFFDSAYFSESEAKDLGVSNVPYSKFCSRINGKVLKELSNTDKIPYQSRFGILNSDLIYLVISDLAALPRRLEHKPPKNKMPSIYRDLRMTLGDYLDALIDISFSKGRNSVCKARADEYRKLKKEFSEIIDLSTPLCKAIDIILEQYTQNRLELNRIDHIIECSNGLKFDLQMEEMRSEFLDYDNCYDYDEEFEEDDEEDENEEVSEDRADKPAVNTVQIEEEGVDKIEFDKAFTFPVAFVMDDIDDDGDWDDVSDVDDEVDRSNEPADKEEYDRIMAEEALREFDPVNYYLSKAKKLPKRIWYSFGSPGENHTMSKEHPNILMVDDFSPEALKAKIDSAELGPAFQRLVEEMITEERVSNAIKDMDAATDNLYRLLILPFVGIDEFTFDHHLTDVE